MLLIQIFIVLFVLFAISRAVVRLRDGVLGVAWFAFWLAMWLVLGVVAVLPQTTTVIAEFLGVGRGVDAVIYTAIIFLFYLVFRLFLKIEKLEHEITLMVRELGLRKAEKTKDTEDDVAAA
jgi:hypothetical protein